MFGAAPTDAELPGPLDSPDLLRRPYPDDSCQVVLRIFVNDTPRHASAGVHCGLVHLACSHLAWTQDPAKHKEVFRAEPEP